MMHTAGTDAVPRVEELLRAAAAWMQRRGIDQWRTEEVPLLRSGLLAAAAAGELFISPCGRAAVQCGPGVPSIWAGAEGPATYLQRLVVHPEAMRQGLGDGVLEWAARRAEAVGSRWLRLDCQADNITLVRWYQARGCLPRGPAALARPGGGTQPVLRLERRLAGVDGEGLRYRRLDEVPWQNWQPETVATLLFLRRDQDVLLIHKKRGLGAGKVNGPGGKLEPGETPLACALRETAEETLVQVPSARHVGQLRFQWTDGSSLHGHVFTAERHSGTPGETDEALPFWCPLDALPWDAMWEDDRLWLPLALEGQPFDARFLVHGDAVMGHRIERTAAPPRTLPAVREP